MLQDWFSPAERPPDPLRDVVSRNLRKKRGITVHRSRNLFEALMLTWPNGSHDKLAPTPTTFSDSDHSLYNLNQFDIKPAFNSCFNCQCIAVMGSEAWDVSIQVPSMAQQADA